MPGDFEYSAFYDQAITNAGGTATSAPMDIKRTIAQLGTLIGTPKVSMLVQATTVGAPAYVKGGLYFDTTLNKLRVGGATAWETVTSA